MRPAKECFYEACSVYCKYRKFEKFRANFISVFVYLKRCLFGEGTMQTNWEDFVYTRPSIYFIINLFHPACPICIKTYAIIPLHGYIIYSGRTSACANTLTTQFRNGRTANGYKSLTIITLWELPERKVKSLQIYVYICIRVIIYNPSQSNAG